MIYFRAMYRNTLLATVMGLVLSSAWTASVYAQSDSTGDKVLLQTAASPSSAVSEPRPPLIAYVGTFSSPLKDTLPTQVDLPPGNGAGIHLFEVDRDSGVMKPVGVYAMGNSPSCLIANRQGTVLYSANETDRLGPGKFGSASALAIDRKSGQLSMINTVDVGSQGPTYVCLSPDERFLLTANYFGGSVSVIPVQTQGKLGATIQVLEDQGTIGPTTAKNAPPGSFAFSGHDRTHAHQIIPDPSGRFMLHVDLALDTIFISKFDAVTGMLAPNSIAKLPPGDGPRHIVFHPNGRWLYSIQEEGSTVVLFDYNGSSGSLVERQTLSTLPAQFKGSNFCSEILVSPDGRFVYAGNRLYDSIAIFSVRDDGSLEYRGEQWTRGNYPRSFSFDPSGKYLYCCNQRADNVTQFRVDRQSGQLEFTGNFAAVGNPSHIVFVDLDR